MEGKVDKEVAEEKILEVKPAPAADDDAQVKERKLPLYQRRHFHLICCVLAAVTFLLGILLLVLVFAVFKTKNPDVWLNGVKLADLNITYAQTAALPRVRLLLDLNITVHNPNRAAFLYHDGVSRLFYEAIEVGHAVVPAGRLGAGNTITQVLTLDVQAEKFLMGSNFTNDFAAGLIPVSATTRVSGRVNVLNVYKRHAVSNSWCTMAVFVANASLASFQCKYTLRQR